MELKPFQLLKEWTQGRLRPVYYLSGEEMWLKTEALEKLIARLKPTPFDSQAWDGESAQAKDILGAARTPPFTAPTRLLVVKRAELLRPPVRSALAEYLKKPAETSCLVVLAEERKPAKSDPLASQAAAWGAIVLFRLLGEREATEWAGDFLKKSDRQAAPEAIQTLIQAAGTSLFILQQELSKLILYTQGQTQPIRKEQALASLGYQAEQNIFELEREVQKRNFFPAFQKLKAHLDGGQDTIGLLRHLIASLEKLLKAKLLIRRGADETSIFQQTGVNSYYNKEFVQWAQDWKEQDLREALRACLDSEGRMKSAAQISSRIELELLVGGWQGRFGSG